MKVWLKIIQDEKIEGTVVNVDGNLYVKFIAKHFSTYAIGEEIDESPSNPEGEDNNKNEEENPATFDDIDSNILMGIISFISLISTLIYLKKENKVRA